MRKRPLHFFLSVLAVSVLLSTPVLGQEKGTWTGEVVDLACYVYQGKADASEKECENEQVKNGQPMGLLTDDGTLVLLRPDPDNDKPYKALANRVGRRVQVSGTLAERDGMKVMTVTGSKAAG